ncbi:glycoside hydrolase family 18 protein [Pedobacter immunditicola]|uniref:glycoside hydrolase family 18 protein n=1 Tax=Pedobacter immunditicola TaxID=3133440 RepID=UPI00309A94A2
MRIISGWLVCFFLLCLSLRASSQNKGNYSIIAYYAGDVSNLKSIQPRKVTHIIYSFCGLRGNRLFLQDTLTVKRLVAMKKQNPQLKVLLALGGWGGCKTCSDVFAVEENRRAFASSVKRAHEKLGTDGLDLDWEYPAIEGFIGHKFHPRDKESFTLLVQQLRKTMGNHYEITFAAGGFQEYLEQSIDWIPVMKEVDRVHIMSYDLVNGYSPVTGHHTALYATPQLKESTDNAVNYLLNLGIPSEKIVIGAAFYARVWENVAAVNKGLYQPAVFKNTVPAKLLAKYYTPANGYHYYWDGVAQAPFLYHPAKKLFVTFDDNRSIKLKTTYVMDKKLNGIMFWQIAHDKKKNSLLGTINEVMK